MSDPQKSDIKNAKTLPQVYYGLHMVEGLAEYSEKQVNEGQPYRILLGEAVLKQMDPTYAGKPVYVHHVDQVNLDNIQVEADGYVAESFYNPPDGKHWAKFIAVSDAAQEAIRIKKWRLSNAYVPKEFSGGGKWHNVDYSKEVMLAEYEHLAIVPNPRYEESIILTPEEFKAYNLEKELELKQLANSKGDQPMFTFFKKTKVENAADLENTSVTLKSGTEKTIKQLINEAEEHEQKGKMLKELDPIHMDSSIKVGDDSMTVNELVEKYKAAIAPKDPSDEEKAAEAKKNEEMEKEKKAKEDLAKKNEEEEKEKKAKEAAEKKQNGNFDALKNAPGAALKEQPSVDLSEDKVARGKDRYGS